jgi:8-oxo-dGTP pyrophosphatase MutT (NUDIX family)
VPGHFTASAFVLHPSGEALLLILHRKLGMWLQPGGHLESSDVDHLGAARREVAEETGVSRLALRDELFDVASPPTNTLISARSFWRRAQNSGRRKR